MLSSCLFAAALAHPVGESVATQTTVLEIHRDHAVVEYVAEVPLTLIRTAARATQPDPFAAMADELASGVVVRADGRDLDPISRRGDPYASSPHTWAFRQQLTVALPPDTETVSVSSANLPEASNRFAAAVRLADGWQVRGCSVLDEEDGRIVADHSLRWRQGDDHRQVSVTLGPRLPAWYRAVVPHRATPSCALVRVPTARGVLFDRQMTPGVWVLVAVGTAAMGWGMGRRTPRGLIVLILGPFFALLPATLASEGVRAAAVALGGLVALRWPAALPFVAMVAVSALAGAAAGPRSAGVLVALAAGASLIGATSRPRLMWGGILVIGALLHGRALIA